MSPEVQKAERYLAWCKIVVVALIIGVMIAFIFEFGNLWQRLFLLVIVAGRVWLVTFAQKAHAFQLRLASLEENDDPDNA